MPGVTPVEHVRSGSAGRLLSRYGWLAATAAIVLLAYSPVLFTEYGFSEDYRLLAALRRGVLFSKLMIAEGRPLYAVWTALFLGPVHGIGQLAIVRLVNLLVLGGVAVTFTLAWRRVGLGRFEAAAAGIATVTLPTFQFFGAMAAVGAHLWGALAAAIAALWTDRLWNTDRRIFVRALPALVLLAGLLAYQPAGMVFWAFAFILLVAPRDAWSVYWPRLRGFVVVGFIGMAASFVVFEIGKTLFAAELAGAPRAEWVRDPAAKLFWFLTFPIPHTLNLWKLHPDLWFALAALIALAAGLVLHHRGLERALPRVLVAFALIPFSYLPNLLVAEDRSSFRSMLALSSLVLAWYVLVLAGQLRSTRGRLAFRTVIAAFAAAGIASAAWNVTSLFVRPQARELEMVRRHTADIPDRYRNILVVRSDWRDALAPDVLYDEFGYPSTALPWSSASMTWLMLMEHRHLKDTTAVRADTAGALPLPADTVLDWSIILRATRQRLETGGD